jgi:hypothetical protein
VKARKGNHPGKPRQRNKKAKCKKQKKPEANPNTAALRFVLYFSLQA